MADQEVKQFVHLAGSKQIKSSPGNDTETSRMSGGVFQKCSNARMS